ncbi:MAG: 3-hydroxyacyl-CoA dehydrogenase/enoyl-CoA hydratase family protein, partial [Rhodothermaceae bacterium]|nr:3-hydroxyacyl-CoA dehydrogenase/enoyl-CoA hydratase family protein [Rhodothermaceae bacterium]
MRSNSTYLPFRRAAVIGAGTMGAQIAAHLANAGVEVLLLDLAAPEGQDPRALVKKRLKTVTKLKPNPFFTNSVHGRISCGTIENDLEKIA